MDYAEAALKMHRENHGKLEMASKIPLTTRDELSTAYTPGVAAPCLKIKEDKSEAYTYTAKGNLVAVVTDGTAVLGLGDIGPEAAMPVMEGKAVLFKKFGGVDAVPICLDTRDTEEIIETVKRIAPTFGGINLEDISAPRCFEIEQRLERELDIPVFHDDQHGTAIVATAALINALKLTGKQMDGIKVIVNGPGSAGTAITEMLLGAGVKDLIVCDEHGALCPGREKMDGHKEKLSLMTNVRKEKGRLEDVIAGADVFIGVSAAGVVSKDMVRTMKKDAIVFAMANPVPEIMYEEAKEAGARVMATGRSDCPNQINNVLVFPGLFRGALDCRARDITCGMKLAAAYGIAGLVSGEELGEEYIIPSAFDERVAKSVAEAVKRAAVKRDVAKRDAAKWDAVKPAAVNATGEVKQGRE
ncbi:NAD-dependent malic enzyme [Enterocloster bolteae]|uniref:NAD(P)-dependent malic enzyme n=1 Tax=Enterocloster bolteae TaxID=208479 RepID=UPI001D087BA8|nr:malic enzyme-like NAD(P)-binding protein [Enterocloster bolteae]MCB6924230.1 NAD-dependent malic enzyme [Enterocloster bolteae]MCQ4757986.1 NAD-dependent malic enzyme [Enterocloster bolteae]